MLITSSGSRLRCSRSRPLARVLLTGLRVEGRFVVYSELAFTSMLNDWFANLVRTCCLLGSLKKWRDSQIGNWGSTALVTHDTRGARCLNFPPKILFPRSPMAMCLSFEF